MQNCNGCTMTNICLKDPDFRRCRPFTRFPDENGGLDYCRLLRDKEQREKILEAFYHRPLPKTQRPGHSTPKPQSSSTTMHDSIQAAA